VPVSIAEKVAEEPAQKFYSPLTGVEVNESLTKRPVTAVMIENSVDARPQAGLQEAGVVFEAIAEGGITRFMALYQEAEPKRLGPLRSARPYYVEWAKGFDASYAHSGGSNQALQLIQSLKLNDLDHGKHPDYFERVSNRYAPHNVYTDMKRLDALKKEKGYTKSDFTPWSRIQKTDEEPAAPATEVSETTPVATNKKATKIEFDISSPLYNTSYSYNSENKTYARTMAGQRHVDEVSGKQITPDVVIGMETSYSIHPNGIHSIYKTTGSGKATIFQNGEVITATWSKKSRSAQLQFLDKDDNPIELAPGQTWITVVPSGRISYTP
jgi:hypothetical protein